MARIVLTTLGSSGDVHPYIAIALGLKARGHEAIFATSEYYRRKVEGLGLTFHPVRPNSEWMADPIAMRRIMASRMGTVIAVREQVLPFLRESYEDLCVACHGADLLVSHMPWASQLVAEKTGIPWVSTMISPFGFFSAYDLPIFPMSPGLSRAVRMVGPAIWPGLSRVLKLASRPWARAYYRVRRELGLPKCRAWNPLGDTHSPQLVLALFSKVLAAPQPDWPPNTVQVGFPVFDQDGGSELPIEVERFLEAGPPPIVFTLGVSAAMVAGRFFEHSIEAATRLGRRAILTTGRNPQDRLAQLPESMIACEYAPFSKLFPRAAAVVHPGGIGTTGLGLRSGRPTLVVPFAHDQPDNAERLARLGVSRTLYPGQYKPDRVVRELRLLLEDSQFTQRAVEVAPQVRQVDGVANACVALEDLLKGVGDK